MQPCREDSRPIGRRCIHVPILPNAPTILSKRTRQTFRTPCEYRGRGSVDVSTDIRTSRGVRSRASPPPGTSLPAPIQRDSHCLATIDRQTPRFRFQLGRRLRRLARIHFRSPFQALSLLRRLTWFISLEATTQAKLKEIEALPHSEHAWRQTSFDYKSWADNTLAAFRDLPDVQDLPSGAQVLRSSRQELLVST